MAQPKASNEGSNGKLIDTWIYEFPALVQHSDDDEGAPRHTVAAKKVPVELRLIKRFTGSTPPLATGEVEFLVVVKDTEDIKFRGTDIEALRVALWDQLDERYKTQWHEYFLVQVTPEAFYDGIGTGLAFGYSNVEKGIAWDGTLLLRQRRWGGETEIKPWPGEFRDKNGKVLACIPATTQNRKSLEEFRARIDVLRKRLADYLRPDQIMQTLANLSQNMLLPPTPDVEDEPSEDEE